jgi:hypothetical protein
VSWFKPGQEVFDQVGDGGPAVVMERHGTGSMDPSEYARVQWADGHETFEPAWRFGGPKAGG